MTQIENKNNFPENNDGERSDWSDRIAKVTKFAAGLALLSTVVGAGAAPAEQDSSRVAITAAHSQAYSGENHAITPDSNVYITGSGSMSRHEPAPKVEPFEEIPHTHEDYEGQIGEDLNALDKASEVR
jgi:hypothetical protein